MNKISWKNGYIEFFENSLHTVTGTSERIYETFAQYAHITRVNFYDTEYVEWYVEGYERLMCPVAKDIFNELTKRLREYNKA